MKIPNEVLELLDCSASELKAVLGSGHAVDPGALAGQAYLGISLGLPGWVDRLAWKTFVKAFARDGDGVRGWNVRMEQGALEGPHRPCVDREGQPKAFGNFRVSALPAGRCAPIHEGAVLLDYGVEENARLDPGRAIRDPLVTLQEDEHALLFGRSYIAVGSGWMPTPSYFVLMRATELGALAQP
jgi:hypothetical protein